jgi:hypothetical protein
VTTNGTRTYPTETSAAARGGFGRVRGAAGLEAVEAAPERGGAGFDGAAVGASVRTAGTCVGEVVAALGRAG